MFFIIILCIVVIIVILYILHKKYNYNIQHYIESPNISCVYAYYEKNEQYKNNLEYFISNGGILPFVTYYIVINGECSVSIPNLPNIIVLKRENVGYDFGAWGDALQKFQQISQCDYVFFMNTSVRGPYTQEEDWTQPFLSLFKTPDVKLVGTSINICSQDFSAFSYKSRPVYPHIQSMFFCVDKEALHFLIKKNIFHVPSNLSFNELIGEKEVGMSMHILDNNWNINCILPKYRDIDYRTIKHDINPTSHSGDAYYENAYFSGSIKPYDVLFYKNTRFSE